jgi:hypothetical protein
MPNMKSIPVAIAWDIWLRGRRQLVYSVVGAVAMLVVLYRSAIHNQWWTEGLSATLFNVFFRIEAIWFIAGACAAIGPARRLYAKPISAAAIAAFQLLPAMAAVTFTHIVVTITFNWMTDSNWPILAPALFLATAVAALQATIWTTAGLDVLRVLVGVAVGYALHEWFTWRHYNESDPLAEVWRTITPGEAVFMFAAVALSFAVSIWSIARDRCGELPWRRLPSLQDLWLRIGCFAGRVRPFRSTRSAQFWSEWREKGYVGPVIFAGYFACVLVWYLAGWSDERGFVFATFTAGYWLVLLFAIMGLSFGKCGGTVRNPVCGSFFATRPMSDTALAYSMLKGAAASIAATALCWVIAMLAVIVLMYARGREGQLDLIPGMFGLRHIVPDGAPWTWWLIPTLTAVGMWTAVGFIAPLVMTGRGWLLALVYTGLFCVLIAHVLIVDWLEKLRVVNAVYWINSTLLALAVLLVVAAFVAAWKKRLISRREVLIAGGPWLGLVLLCLLPLHVGTAIRGGAEYMFLWYYADIFVPVFAVLPLFPLAAAPLAIHWNRHR